MTAEDELHRELPELASNGERAEAMRGRLVGKGNA